MQKIATKVFIYASVVFGVLGILVVLTLPMRDDEQSSDANMLIGKLLIATGFVVLSSFALSVAGKYLSGKR
jgi:hypothetical protein